MGVSRVPALPNVLLTFSFGLVLALAQNEAPQKPEGGGILSLGANPPGRRGSSVARGRPPAQHATLITVQLVR